MKTDYREVWREVLSNIEQRITQGSFLTWIGPLRFLEGENGVINIGVPNHFHYGFLEVHYHKLIESALDEVTAGKLSIKYQILQEEITDKVAIKPQHSQPVNRPENGFDEKTQLNPRYSFTNFIEGAGNKFARAASLAVAEAPGNTIYNPFPIHHI